jgi:hypothetical protein
LIGAGCANEDLFQQRIGPARKELQTRIQAGRLAASSLTQNKRLIPGASDFTLTALLIELRRIICDDRNQLRRGNP